MEIVATGTLLLVVSAMVATVMAIRSERRRWDDVRRAVPNAGPSADPTSLERAIRESFAELRLAAHRAEVEARLARAALDSLHIGVIMTDDIGRVLFRNAAAKRLVGDRQPEPSGGPSGVSDATGPSGLAVPSVVGPSVVGPSVVGPSVVGQGVVGPSVVGQGAVDEVLREAVEGRPGTRTIELFGPPRRFLVLSGLRLSGETDGALVIIDDITERRRTDAIRRDFVANIGHELRTPVGALAVLAETLADSADDEDPSTLRRLAGRADTEAHRLTGIVDDLLSLARLEADEDSEHVPVSVAQVVREAADRAVSSADRYGVKIAVTPVDDDLFVCGDRRQLVTGIHNLLVNAVKYSDKGLPVEISARRSDHATVEIQVRDRGIGIPARDRERIFERFYRVDRARARDTGGTGLGLAIVRHVAMNHHGTVHVESLEGEGSTFGLEIPSVENERQGQR